MARELRRRRTPALVFELCPGAQRLVSEYAERITGAWYKTIDSVFEVSGVCAEADEKLNDEEWEELLLQLPFDRTRFIKLARIGRDQRLQDPEIRPLLPNHHTIISELAGLTDDELKAAVEAKIVHPEMKRATLTNWVKDRRGQGGRDDKKNPTITVPKGHLAIRLPTDGEAALRLQEALFDVCAAHGGEIIYPRAETLAEERERRRRYRKYKEHLVREARKIVSEERRRRLKGRPHNVPTEEWRRMRWPFAPGETPIADDDENHIQQDLEILGRQDEFERIRNEAMREL